MTPPSDDPKIVFRLAKLDQADAVLGVLNEAAAWLQDQGITQWPARFESSWIEEAILQGETWLVEVGGANGGTVTVDWSDAAWSDVCGDAGYIHRMAVRRCCRGLGSVILAWAAEMVRQHNRSALRLDCVASNDRLRAYYETAGFIYRGDVTVGGAPGQRLDIGPVTVVSRYEMPVDTSRWLA